MLCTWQRHVPVRRDPRIPAAIPPVEPGKETVRPVASTHHYEEKVGPDPREHEWHRDDAGCVLGGACGSEHHVPVQPRLHPTPFESAAQNAPSRMR
jgi:hypothetical protein